MPRRRRRNQGGGEDIDYLNKDAIYTSEADSNYANAFDALSNILSQQNLAYRGIDQQRDRNVEAKKLAGQTAANSAASRGLGSSGIYRGNERKVQEQDTNRVNDTNLAADDTAQTYGARNALAQQMGAGWSLDQAIKDKNYTELAKVFGLLGSYGASTGTAFSNAMSQSAAGAASRATSKAFDSLRRWQ
jgi:hypothetical protein